MLNRRLLLPLFALIIIASSCSSKFSVTKRRYTKGYHVDFAKNKAVKTIQSQDGKISGVKTQPLVKEAAVEKHDLYAAKTEITSENKKESSVNKLTAIKNFKTIVLNNNLSKAYHEKNTLKHTAFNSLIETKTKLLKGLKTNSNNLKNANIDPFCGGGGGGGGGGNIGMAILYFFGSLIAIFLFYMIAFLIIAVLSGASAPSWLGGALLAIALIAIVAIIVVVVINGD